MLTNPSLSPAVLPGNRSTATEAIKQKPSNALYAVSTAQILPTGFSRLDRILPGGGWPVGGVIEIIAPSGYVDPLSLLLPALAELSRDPIPRWISWIAPPHLPINEDLLDAGLALNRTALVHRRYNFKPVRAIEQALLSGHHSAIVAWVRRLDNHRLAGLSRIAREHRTTVFLIRPGAAEKENSNAELRVYLATHSDALHIEILQSHCTVGNALELAGSDSPILYTPRYYRRQVHNSQHQAIASRIRMRELSSSQTLPDAAKLDAGKTAHPASQLPATHRSLAASLPGVNR